MPQFDPTSFPSQIFWLVVTFVALYLVMVRYAIPRIAEVLEKRQSMIDGDLEAAEKLKEETEAAIAAYETALAEARAKAHDEIKAVTDAASAEAEKRNAEASQRINAQIKDGETRIANAKSEALSHIRDVATAVAGETVSKLAGITVDGGKASAAVDASMGSKS